jgi:hypothetical protein
MDEDGNEAFDCGLGGIRHMARKLEMPGAMSVRSNLHHHLATADEDGLMRRFGEP